MLFFAPKFFDVFVVVYIFAIVILCPKKSKVEPLFIVLISLIYCADSVKDQNSTHIYTSIPTCRLGIYDIEYIYHQGLWGLMRWKLGSFSIWSSIVFTLIGILCFRRTGQYVDRKSMAYRKNYC